MVFENSLAAYEGARLMDKNKDLRKLPLSHLVYLNNNFKQIKIDLKQLTCPKLVLLKVTSLMILFQ